jgi:hypothetical protein
MSKSSKYFDRMQDTSFTMLEQVLKYRVHYKRYPVPYRSVHEHSFLFRILYCLVWHDESLLTVGCSSVEDPDVFGPPGSGSISQRFGSGSFPFLINVLSGRLKMMYLWVSYKKKI